MYLMKICLTNVIGILHLDVGSIGKGLILIMAIPGSPIERISPAAPAVLESSLGLSQMYTWTVL